MRLWAVKTIMNQVFRVVANNSIEAMATFHKAFPVEKKIRSINDEGYVYIDPEVRPNEQDARLYRKGSE